MKITDLSRQPIQQSSFSYNGSVSHLVTDLLGALGEDPTREGLLHTPERVSRMYGELLSGYRTDLTTLVNGAIFEGDYDDLVVVKDIEFTSLCEHHLLPFYGRAHVAYLPDGKVIGLSKIPRIVEMFARRLQIQERMTREIAATIEQVLAPKGVAVIVEGTHMCAMIRGVKKSGMRMMTRSLRGAFKADAQARSELGDLLKGGRVER